MADYVSILNKAISGLGENNAGNRQVIYQKARGAIDRKLRSMDPPPSEDAIAGQLSQLEEAINQVEGEQQLAALSVDADEAVLSDAPAALSAPAAPEKSAAPAAESKSVDDAPVAEAAASAATNTASDAASATSGSIPAPNPPEGFVDDVILIDGIGEKTRAALEEEGVTGISQIAAMSDGQLASITEKIGYPGFEQTQEWKKQAGEMLGGDQPRSKTDQERLKKLKEELAPPAAAPASPEPASAKATQPDIVSQSADDEKPPTASEIASKQEDHARPPVAPPPVPGAPAEPTVPVPDIKKAETPVAVAADPVAVSKEAPAEPSPEVPAASTDPLSTAKPADDQTAFADAIAQLTGDSAKKENVPAAATPDTQVPEPDVAPVSAPAPSIASETLAPQVAQPQVGTTTGAELNVRADAPLAGSADAPPYVGQIDGDPLAGAASAQRTQEAPMPEADFGRSGTIPKPRRSLGKTLGCTGLIALLGAAAYGGWIYQDQVKEYGGKAVAAVQELFGGSSDNAPATTPSDDTDSSSETSEEKSEDRLGSDDTSENPQDDSSAEPAEDGVTTTEEDAPRNILADPVEDTQATVEVEGQDNPLGEDSEENAGTDADSNGDAATDDTATDADTGGETVEGDNAASETVTPAPEPAIAAGEAAFLYEEAIGATGANRDEGGIVWTLAEEAPEAGAPPEAVIKGLVEIPARGLKLNVNIKRNIDPGLPASHIIELLFTAPPDFSGGNIDGVSRFVMKASEQARGESLVGVPARIDVGFFLIALNNLDQAQQTNARLLENGEWIDIPVAYVTGRRGLITLAKGETGRKVFADALADWRNR